MKLRSDEWLRLTPGTENGKRVLDIRIWRRTPTGGMPTKKSLAIETKLIVPLIMQLQKIHQFESKEASQTTEVTQG